MKKKKKFVNRNKPATVVYRNNQENPPFPNPRVILTVMILVIAAYGLFRLGQHMIDQSNMFVMNTIKVEGNQWVEDKEILALAALKPGIRLFQVPKKQVSERILKNLYLRGVSISRSLPSTLIIAVQERQPVAYLVDQKIYMVDEHGKILLKKPAMELQHLPLITGLTVSSLLKDRQPLLEALGLIRLIQSVDKELFQFISEIHISRNESPQLYLIRGGAQVNLGSDHLARRVYILSEFIRDTEILNQLEEIRKMDLTYKDRVIVTWKS
ncbi:MAG: FtsQ-type POTRA domain-containing protein [Calditrichaeota bacterium]|nr:FtsQ-type POTRA domain-containing protein [Calditrichota bacterium]RQV99709.1 MAG: FtsQ-type POTRA domain-containing protein [Calditrichota bacterium]